MSRLIKKSIPLPVGVTIAQEKSSVTVKGPKGELKVALVPGVLVASKDGGVWVEQGKDLANMAMLGTTWSLIRNAIEGVTKGFSKKLEIEGVGYRAAVEGKDLVLYLGYAQPVRVTRSGRHDGCPWKRTRRLFFRGSARRTSDSSRRKFGRSRNQNLTKAKVSITKERSFEGRSARKRNDHGIKSDE